MRFSLIAICSLAATSAAGEFVLEFPLDCTLDETCFIQQFVDNDPSAIAPDFACGSLTYDGHKAPILRSIPLPNRPLALMFLPPPKAPSWACATT